MSAPKPAPVEPGFSPGVVPQDGSRLDLAMREFKETHRLTGKGQIATMIYASRLARELGLPIDVVKGIRTEGEGQVRGLGKASVQKVLESYDIKRTLAEEGGRTSRGSLGNIQTYIGRLNALHADSALDDAALASLEAWWVDQAKLFFNAKPFALRFEPGMSLRAVVRDLIAQAKLRQKESAGTKFVGAMLQHLLGAKLELALPEALIDHNGFSVADAPTGRSGDFEIGNAAIHVTTAPGEAVMRKCAQNLASGLQPIIVTVYEMIPIAEFHATELGIEDKIDLLDAEQFIVANLHELGAFNGEQRRVNVEALIDKYNEIVDAHETDPSLRISKR